jgi:hypothetical protein
MFVTNFGKVVPRSFAISLSASQNSASRLMLVLRPPMMIDRFSIEDFKGRTGFMACSPDGEL